MKLNSPRVKFKVIGPGRRGCALWWLVAVAVAIERMSVSINAQRGLANWHRVVSFVRHT